MFGKLNLILKITLWDIIVLFLFSFLTYNLANGACDVCQENSVACVNLTSYHMCFGASTPNTDQLFTCPDGLVCTDLPNICFQSSTVTASCGDTSSCGQCNSNQVFACTSRTTFAFCFGATVPSDVLGTCPTGLVCDASNENICVDETTSASIICDLEYQSVKSLHNNIFYHNRKKL